RRHTIFSRDWSSDVCSSDLVGFIFTTFVTEPIRNWLSRTVNRIPLFNTLYSSIKDFTEAFVGDAKKFNEPVLVKVNDMGLKKIEIGRASCRERVEMSEVGE